MYFCMHAGKYNSNIVTNNFDHIPRNGFWHMCMCVSVNMINLEFLDTAP